MMKRATAQGSVKTVSDERGSRGDTPDVYAAYAVDGDGQRRPIQARSIIVIVGGREIEFELVASASPTLAGQLSVAARGHGLLVIGHADASSMHLAVVLPGEGRLRPS